MRLNNELAAICTEHPPVFAVTHQLLFDLLDEGTLTGLLIDHPNGLYDLRGYLCQLQEQQFLTDASDHRHQIEDRLGVYAGDCHRTNMVNGENDFLQGLKESA